MNGLRVRLLRIEARQAERAGGWPPAGWSLAEVAATEEAIRRVAADRGLDPADALHEATLMWESARRRGATSLNVLVERLAADRGRTVAQVLAEAERRWSGSGPGGPAAA
jgi:hypothetical protein